MLTLTLFCTWAASCGSLIPAKPGTVLFQDDFERPSSGWDVYQTAETQAGYLDSAYRIRIGAPNTIAWSTPGFELGDVRLEVDATAVSGPLDNILGLICRFQDPDNFYFLLVSSDGYSGIGVVRDGLRSLLTGEAMLPSDFIIQGLASNRLQADCVGDQLRLYVNGVLVNEATASEWASGDVGLLAGTYRDAGVDIRFDNLVVVQP